MTKVSTNLADKETLSHRIAYRTVRNLVTWFCCTWCRMKVEGREHIPSTGVFKIGRAHV